MAQFIPVAIGLAGLAISAYGAVKTYDAQEDAEDAQRKAKNKAEELANLNAEAIRKETEEELRRAREDTDRKASSIRAKLAASGVRGTTPESYMSAFLQERDKEIEWIKTSGNSRADIAKRGGANVPNLPGGSTAQLLSSGVSAAADSYSWYERYIK